MEKICPARGDRSQVLEKREKERAGEGGRGAGAQGEDEDEEVEGYRGEEAGAGEDIKTDKLGDVKEEKEGSGEEENFVGAAARVEERRDELASPYYYITTNKINVSNASNASISP